MSVTQATCAYVVGGQVGGGVLFLKKGATIPETELHSFQGLTRIYDPYCFCSF